MVALLKTAGVGKGALVEMCERKLYAFLNFIIESHMVLPELAEFGDIKAVADVSFQVSTGQSEYSKAREWLHHWRAPDQSITLSLARDEDILFLHFPGMARFAIADNGRLVTCHARPDLSFATIRHLLLDQVLPRLFAHFFSCTVLHASFVVVHGKGICFLADSGKGKSTIAAALGAAGHMIVTDDCVNIAVHNQRISGTPAYCGIRLLPDSIEYLWDTLNLPVEVVAEYTSKKRISLKSQVASVPGTFPLEALFVLTSPHKTNDCNIPEIEPVSGMHTIKELLKNCFCLDVHDQQWQKAHFQRISEVAASGLPVFSLRYPRKYKNLPDVVKAIVKTLDQL